MSKFTYIKNNCLYLGIILFLVLLFIFFYFSNTLFPFQSYFQDKLFVQNKSKDNRIVVLEIDDKSLEEIGAWPWNRDVYAEIVDKLGEENVEVIGFDTTFFEPREGDNELIESIENFDGKIVFASKLNSDGNEIPVDSLLIPNNASYGYANFIPDKDTAVRKTKIETENNSICNPSFAYEIVREYLIVDKNLDCSNNSEQLRFNSLKTDNGSLIINYYGLEGSFETISVKDLLDNNYPDNYFKDKIVLIGSTIEDLKNDLNDTLTSPVSSSQTPGVIIHANVIKMILDSDFLYPISDFLYLLILMCLSVICCFVFNKFRVTYTLIILALILILYPIITVILFSVGILMDIILIPILIILIWITSVLFRYLKKSLENIQIKRAFSQYVNEHILSEILKDPNKLKLGGELSEMTVLFSDIRSFTSISEKMQPEVLVKFLNRYFTNISDLIMGNEGVIDKYIGDAVMAFWGAPLKNELQATLACSTAVKMLDFLEEFNNESDHNNPKIEIGIGINSGKMVVGNMGSDKRFDYTVIGDNVNLGSRLEGLTKYYKAGIIISEYVFDKLLEESSNEEFNIRILDRIVVKGKGVPIKIFEVRKDKNKIVCEDYEKALEYYFDGKFDKASELFIECNKLHNDETSRIMAERCGEILKNKKMQKEWKGIWYWDTK